MRIADRPKYVAGNICMKYFVRIFFSSFDPGSDNMALSKVAKPDKVMINFDN